MSCRSIGSFDQKQGKVVGETAADRGEKDRWNTEVAQLQI